MRIKKIILYSIFILFSVSFVFSTIYFGSTNNEPYEPANNTVTDILSQDFIFNTSSSEGWVNQLDSFFSPTLSSKFPQAITTNGSDFWIVDNVYNWVYHTKQDGTNISDGFSTLPIGSDYPVGITTNGSDFWITDQIDNWAYHTDADGVNQTDGFSTSEIGSDFPTAITTNGSDFWITDQTDNWAYHIDASGNNISDGFSIPSLPYGITTNGSDFWITDYNQGKVVHFDALGNDLDDGFSTKTFGADSPTNVIIFSEGLLEYESGTPTNFYILDQIDKYIYHQKYTTLDIDECSLLMNINDGGWETSKTILGDISVLSTSFPISTFDANYAKDITTNGSDFWITDNTADMVFHINKLGENLSGNFSTAVIGANNPNGITTNGSDFWITDFNDKWVYHTDADGVNQSDGFSTADLGANSPYGITTNGSDFWITDYDDDWVYHTDADGVNQTDGFSTATIGSDLPAAITTNGSDFWITDYTDEWVYHTDAAGNNISDGFLAPGSDSPSGITVFSEGLLEYESSTPTNFYMVDYTDKFVFHLGYVFEAEINHTINVDFDSSNQEIDWKIGCYNLLGTQFNSSQMFLTLDFTAPITNLQVPTNYFNSSTSSVNFTFNTTDVESDIDSAILWLKKAGTWELNFTDSSITETINQTINITIEDSNILWLIEVNDTLNNKANSTTYNLTVDTTAPIISLWNPTNNTNSSSAYINFTFNTTDLNSDVDSAILWLKKAGTWELNFTDTSITETINQTINITIEDSNILWLIEVNDTLNNKANSTTYNLTVDTIIPAVAIDYPTNTTYRDYYNQSFELNTTISDTNLDKKWYSLNLGNTNTTFTENSIIINLSAGSNTIIVYANDTFGNENNSNVTFSLTFTPKINEINISNFTSDYLRGGNQTGLVGWWKFDENRSDIAKDYSTSSNNGTITGAVWNSSGKIGGAYEFDGDDDYVNVGNINITNNELTMMAWIKPKSDTVGIRSVVRQQGSGYIILGYESVNHLISTDGVLTHCASNDGKWHHIAFTYINDTTNGFKSYHNGVFCAQKDSTNLPDPNAIILIGARDDGSETFNGTIDEVQIWNRSLSATEIQELYYVTNPTFQERANVTINVTITDEDTSQASLYYEWFVDEVKKLWGFAENVFNYIFTDEEQEVKLVVNDSSGYNVTQIWNLSTNFVSPIVSNQAPINYFNSSTSSVNFTFNTTDVESDIDSAILWLKKAGTWELNFTDSSITETINQTINITIEDSNILWLIEVNDTLNNKANSTTYNLTIDTTAPIIELRFPNNNTNSSTPSVNFTYNVTDLTSDIKNCTLWINNGTWYSNFTDTTISKDINQTINITSEDQNVLWKIGCYDSADNQGNSSAFNLTIDTTSPTISLDEPLDGASLVGTTQTLKYTPTDTNLDNCTLIITDGIAPLPPDRIQSSPTSGTQITEPYINTFNYATWSWYVNCIDYAGNSLLTSDFTFTTTEGLDPSDPDFIGSGSGSSSGGTVTTSTGEVIDLFCGDEICSSEIGETISNCPQDCSELLTEKDLGGAGLFMIILVVLLALYTMLQEPRIKKRLKRFSFKKILKQSSERKRFKRFR